jgi:ribosomal protein L11 methylase PrmA
MGCDTGKYSEVLLQNKTKSIVGFDFDFDALEAAVSRAAIKHLRFLPLFCDAANPSPQQGWAETERLGLHSRSGADAVVALAIVHHLAISRNIPLRAVIEWLVGLAPHGVIEFVPKSDPMIQRMPQQRRISLPTTARSNSSMRFPAVRASYEHSNCCRADERSISSSGRRTRPPCG